MCIRDRCIWEFYVILSTTHLVYWQYFGKAYGVQKSISNPLRSNQQTQINQEYEISMCIWNTKHFTNAIRLDYKNVLWLCTQRVMPAMLYVTALPPFLWLFSFSAYYCHYKLSYLQNLKDNKRMQLNTKSNVAVSDEITTNVLSPFTNWVTPVMLLCNCTAAVSALLALLSSTNWTHTKLLIHI